MDLDDLLRDTRGTLTYWGNWWRRNGNHIGYPRTNQIYQMMEVAKLGVRVQHSPRHSHSEEICVPPGIERIDAVIARLPSRDGALLVYLYQQAPPGWNRRTLERKSKKLHKALCRAEVRIRSALLGESEQSLETAGPYLLESIPRRACIPSRASVR